MGAIQAVAFDVDGTLYSEPLLYLRSILFGLRYRSTIRHFRHIRAPLHNPHLTPPADLRLWQITEFAARARISEAQAEERINSVIYRKWIARAARMPLLDGVKETLLFLQQRNIPLAILSDFPPQQKLAQWDIAAFFCLALNSETTNMLKPHHTPFEALAAKLQLSPHAILYVGNNPRYDIGAAHRLGFMTAYYKDRLQRRQSDASIPPDTFVFSRYTELQRYLQQKLGAV